MAGGGPHNASGSVGDGSACPMLKTRLPTAVILLAVFLAALFLLPPNGWVAFCAVACALAAWEWGALAALAKPGRCIYVMIVLAVAGSLAAIPGVRAAELHAPLPVYYAAAFFWLVMAPLWIWRGPYGAGRAVMFAAGLMVLVPALAAIIDLRSIDPVLLLSVMGLVWTSDTAAYLAGRRFGRRKLAPAVSPGKTWEGVVGALIAVMIYAMVWVRFGGTTRMPAWVGEGPAGAAWMVLLLLGLALGGIIGDLFESLIKREAGVKDSGTLLPGHGGVLDRIDALLPVLPLAVLVFLG
jgi:phosphatidate cytidylyltransferase